MGQLGGGNSQGIGGVHFAVRAVGAEQASKQVDAAAASVQNLGNTAQAAEPKVAGVRGALSSFASTVKDATKPMRDAIGAITGVIGAFTRMLGIVGFVTAAIAGVIAGIRSLAEWLNNTNTKTREAAKGMREYGEAMAALRTASSDPAAFVSPAAMATMEAAVKKLAELRAGQIGVWNYLTTNVAQQKQNEAEINSLKITIDLLREKFDLKSEAAAAAERDLAFWRKTTEEVSASQRKMWDEVAAERAANEAKIDADRREKAEKWHSDNMEYLASYAAFQEQTDRNHQENLEAQLEIAKKTREETEKSAKAMTEFVTEQNSLFNGSDGAYGFAQMTELLQQIANNGSRM